jgi:hypothetical protein
MITHALGGTTFKLKFGHRGGNQPVKNVETGKVSITAQNHGFATDPASIKDRGALVTEYNLNDNTVEGLRHKELPVFCVQYHPEAAPGPERRRPALRRLLPDGGVPQGRQDLRAPLSLFRQAPGKDPARCPGPGRPRPRRASARPRQRRALQAATASHRRPSQQRAGDERGVLRRRGNRRRGSRGAGRGSPSRRQGVGLGVIDPKGLASALPPAPTRPNCMWVGSL